MSNIDVNIDRFLSWSASVSDHDVKQMVYNYKINRSMLCQVTGIGRTALKTNENLIKLLQEFEDKLSARGVFGKLAETDELQKPEDVKPIKREDDPQAREMARLKNDNSRLHKKVIELQAELSRYTELKQTIAELGLLHTKP